MRKFLKPLTGLARSAEGSIAAKVTAPSFQSTVAAKLYQTIYQPISHYTPGSVVQWVKGFWNYRVGSRHAFQTYKNSNGIFPMIGDANGDIRIALAGDWGSGTEEAYQVGQRIKEGSPHYTIHLGDVYYVGDREETLGNFLGMAVDSYEPCAWPRGTNGTFALCGNHEMYSRGFSYYDLVLPDMKGQEAAYFCLENPYWRIIGLDTGYNSIGIPILENLRKPSCGLRNEVIDWVRNVVRPISDDRGLILLTHHQYYSAFEDQYPKAAQQLAAYINRPVLWFWGHEHRMTIYNKYTTADALTAYGRCIGHGGMPVEIISPINDIPVIYTDKRMYPNNENLKVGYNGYAELTFNKNNLQVNYKDLTGSVVYNEHWIAGNGILRSDS